DGGGGGGGGVPFILYTVEFDFYAIDSWDGDGPPYGPDVFEVISNSGTLFHETISNGTIAQTYRAPDVGPVQLGYGSRWDDSIYRDIRLSFRVPDDAQSVNLKFRGVGLQLLNDESWGIDNVTLSYEVAYGAVPAPAGLGAGLGLLCIGGRRRAR
ncbi:MAG TPA: hypothetical protein VFF69_02020, partial [Phycisphaerales bacterium]|nr:hypothetical protein [Phycisphaerales bacterium]